MPIKINGTNTAANPSITGDDTDTGIVYGSDQIDLSTGGSSKVTLSGSNLGIGTTSPSSFNADGRNLVVGGGAANTGITIASSSATGLGKIFFAREDPATGSNNRKGLIAYEHQNEAMTFHTGVDERMRITSAGNVEIDSFNSPSTRTLSLRTGYAANANGGSGIAAKDHSGAAADGLGIYGTDGVSIHTASAGTVFERVRINTDGNMLVGTTTNTVNSANFGVLLGADGTFRNFRNVDGNSLVLRTGGNQGLIQINGDGDAFNTNNSYGQLSDETLKQDIVDAASQWNDIKNLRVRKFRFKDNPTGVLQIGVIAQETEKVSAGLVQEDSEGIKSVKYSVLYMKAVKCLQEAMTRIETLETKVAALEAA